jgi:hypothetical protein
MCVLKGGAMHFIRLALPLGECLRIILLATLCVVSVALYGSFGRPIWIDEFLHFATAAFDNTEQAWSVIRQSITGVNHGQTGIYMLLDYWLLKAFGASILALRSPSLLSAALMLYACATLLRLRGFGLFWQCFAIFVLFCQPHLMYYTGEARPYMPLAAASVGALVFAVATPDQRRQWTVRILGGGSILFGALMHPYFSLYWLAIFCFGFWFAWVNQERTLSFEALKNYLNIPLCVVGSAVYFGIASLTWLVSHPRFDRDPFQQIPQTDLVRIFVWHHTEFFGFPERGAFLLAAIGAFTTAYFFLPLAIRSRLKPMLGPAVLVLVALGLSGLLSLMSYFQNYWILTRQWVASIALVGVGSVWLCAELVRAMTKMLEDAGVVSSRKVMKCLSAVFLGLILLYGIRLNQHNLRYRVDTLATYLSQKNTVKSIDLEKLITCPMDNHAWSVLANLNAQGGGAVWPVFSKYYAQALGGPDVCLENIKSTLDLRIK